MVTKALKVSAWTTAREAFWLAMEALRTHKLRSFLTLLGVVIATTTLIVVMSVVNGMNLYIADHIANLGTNTFVLHQFQWAQGFDELLKARRRNLPMRIDDYDYLHDTLTDYEQIGAMANLSPSPSAHRGGHVIDEINLNAMTPSFADIGREKVASGRYINDSDYRHSARVAVIGNDLVEKLFPNVDPLDKEVTIGGIPFRVIGVTEKVGSAFGQSEDNFAIVPLTTYRNIWVARPELSIYIKAPDAQHMRELEDEVRALMRVRRHVPYDQADTFGVNASDSLMSVWNNLTGSIFAVTIGLVAVFMVVGGVVIMNIMLASVTERTHEIGIRKSVGARRRDILWQFVIESGVMSGIGGVAGVLLAIGIAAIVNQFFTASVSPSAMIVGVALSASVGLFFGIYPARKAANLDPIEALRME
ncbi:MAG TPA: ABC transporter permease [Bryobacteraceae bacterium]|jgi:putative ABC transport system permease protein|nr:ABC transporter permease [Bryobacteraceae bacterium]